MENNLRENSREEIRHKGFLDLKEYERIKIFLLHNKVENFWSFADLEKAFARVVQKELCYALLNYGIDGRMQCAL